MDVDYGGDGDKKNSLTGYNFMDWKNAIIWKLSCSQSLHSLNRGRAYCSKRSYRGSIMVEGTVNELDNGQHRVIVNCDN